MHMWGLLTVFLLQWRQVGLKDKQQFLKVDWLIDKGIDQYGLSGPCCVLHLHYNFCQKKSEKDKRAREHPAHLDWRTDVVDS